MGLADSTARVPDALKARPTMSIFIDGMSGGNWRRNPSGQVGGAESAGQEIGDRGVDCFPACAERDHPAGWTELEDHLAAGTAGRSGGRCRRVDDDALQLALIRSHSGENGGALGAVAQAVGSVLHIAAGKDLPGPGEYRGADVKPGIRSVSAA